IQDGTNNTVLIAEELAGNVCGFAQSEYRIREGNTAWLEVRRLKSGTGQIAVPWRVTCEGAASPLEDTTVISGTAYLGANEASAFIELPFFEDGRFEGPEIFTVSLSDTPLAGSVANDRMSTRVIVEDADYFVPQAGGYCGLVNIGNTGALLKCRITDAGGISGTMLYQGAR
ncbi:MAG: hypothetical protein KDM64_20300, partial [Verrucomicrobiae bacterium]|nr:hypothetical protein [Verrucomicrobiae bacterium]